MNKHEKFLEFNGKSIVFLSVDGTYWIPLKPICDALGVDYIRCFKNAKNDPILGPELSKQTMQVSKNGQIQGRNMTCIPEEFIYGWIFSLRSDSKELTEYKKTCYRLLYNHFHGTVTQRKDLLKERAELDKLIFDKEEEMKEKLAEFNEYKELKKQRATISRQLNSMDTEVINQLDIFSDN